MRPCPSEASPSAPLDLSSLVLLQCTRREIQRCGGRGLTGTGPHRIYFRWGRCVRFPVRSAPAPPRAHDLRRADVLSQLTLRRGRAALRCGRMPLVTARLFGWVNTWAARGTAGPSRPPLITCANVGCLFSAAGPYHFPSAQAPSPFPHNINVFFFEGIF